MTSRRSVRWPIALLTAWVCASSGHAFVQRRAASGAPCHWRNPATIEYAVDRLGSRDIPTDGGRDQVRNAFTWWSMDPRSSLRMTPADGPPRDLTIARDDVNAVAWIEDPDFEGLAPDVLGSTRLYVDAETGEIYEADIWLNGVSYTWSPLWSEVPSSASGPAHVQAVLTHLVGQLIGLDQSVDREATMFPTLAVGSSEGLYLRPDEEAAVHVLYPAAGGAPETQISGRVTKLTMPVEGAYVSARDLDNGAIYGAITDASGVYALHLPHGGRYRLRIEPYTADPRITLSPYYRALPLSGLDFLASGHPVGPLSLGDGQSMSSVDFAISPSGSMDDPYEPDDTQPLARPISTDGTPQLHHSWTEAPSPARDDDWVSFESRPGHLYVIDTDRTGHSIARFGVVAPEFARTSLRLQYGPTVLAQNDSRDAVGSDPRSRIAFVETQGPRTLTVCTSMRDDEVAGAGAYYEVSVTDVTLPSGGPSIASVLPSSGAQRGGYVVAIRGSGFVPGAQARFGATPAVVESVEECNVHLSCARILAIVPGGLPGVVDVAVTNPGGASATLAGGFTYLAPSPGSFENAWASAFGATDPAFLGYGQAVCFGDYDNDGWVDLFRGANPPAGYPGNLLLHNRRGTYTDVTGDALGFVPSWITSCAWGDYDNDGWLDLLVLHDSAGGELFHNERDGTFSPGVLASSGGRDAAWLDYDHDGCLDLFVAQAEPDGKNQLWRNRCDGSFVDVAPGMGLAVARHTARVAVHDLDGDGWDDLYLANWSATADVVYRNQAGASFVDVTAASGISETRQCADVKIGDLNGDGAPEIVCSGETRGTVDSIKPPLWINNGTGQFTNRAQAAGLWALPRYCMAITLFDRDNDGTEDLYLGCERAPFPPHTAEDLDVLLANDSATLPTLTDVTAASGIDEALRPRTAWATAVADVDRDGDQDLYSTGNSDFVTGIVPDDSDAFWSGTTTAPWERSPVNDWIRVRLRGGMQPAGTANLSPTWGQGARVTVVYDLGDGGSGPPSEGACLTRPLPSSARAIVKQMVGGSHGQNAPELWFGLGVPRPESERYVDCVIVDWPSGLRRAYTGIAVNSYVELVEAADSVRVASVTPSSGPVAGGTVLQIAGFRFDAGASVLLGATPAGGVTVVSESLITCSAPPHPAGVVDVTVINPDGSSDTIVDGYAYVLPTGSIETVDPNPLLRNGASVTTDPVLLAATPARGVFGFAADGVTPVVLRLPVPSPGTVDFAVYDEARRTTGVGALRAPASTSSGPTVTVSATAVGSGYVAVAILTSPGSFARDAQDIAKSERAITIEATFHPSSGGTTRVTTTFFVVRPPVLLLHGLWAGPDSWAWHLMRDPRFVVHAHDYSRTNDRSFFDNRWVPAAGARETLEKLRARGLAGTQVTVFAHSMGGVLARLHASGHRTDYARDENFNAGDFDAFVSVDSAHRGSPLADIAGALRSISPLGRDLELMLDAFGVDIRNGAIGDLQTVSYETTHLPAAVLPVHAFVSVGGSDLIERGIETAGAMSGGIALARTTLELFGGDFDLAFPPEMQHDLVVGRLSQEGGIDRTSLFHYVDSDNKALHSDSVTRESIPNARAIELIDTPTTDSSTWAPGFPAAAVSPWAAPGTPIGSPRPPVLRSPSIAPGSAITILAPRADALFRQGDAVTVVVDPGSGFVPVRMAIYVTDSDARLLRSAPWSATLHVAQETIGASAVRVLAIDASGVLASAQIPIHVSATAAELVGLTVRPEEVRLFDGKQEAALSVVGSFTDGVERRVTSGRSGTTYDSQDSSIATVSSDGIVSGHAIGSTSVIVRNGTTLALVPVTVERLPLLLRFESKALLSWPRNPDAVGYDVVSGSLASLRAAGGSFSAAVTACVASGTTLGAAPVSAAPPVGSAFFYLARMRLPGAPVSYDEFPDWMGNQVGKRDASIAVSPHACPP